MKSSNGLDWEGGGEGVSLQFKIGFVMEQTGRRRK